MEIQCLGYYSILYSDIEGGTRNLGILLVVPMLKYLKVQIAITEESLKYQACQAMKHSIEIQKDSFVDIGRLTYFIDTRMNSVLLSKLKSVKITVTPDQELSRLCLELV